MLLNTDLGAVPGAAHLGWTAVYAIGDRAHW